MSKRTKYSFMKYISGVSIILIVFYYLSTVEVMSQEAEKVTTVWQELSTRLPPSLSYQCRLLGNALTTSFISPLSLMRIPPTEKTTLQKKILFELVWPLLNQENNKGKFKQLKNLGNFFQQGGLIWHKRKQRNILDLGLSSLEYANIKNFASENIYRFFFESSYQCVRPDLYQYFQEFFNFTPRFSVPIKCQSKNNVFIYSLADLLTFRNFYNSNSKISIDPTQVYQVHYLLAGKSSSVASRFGHAMLRIILCNGIKDSKELDECIHDPKKNLVISYRAHVEDVVISTYKGLNGDYPSKQFIMRLDDVIDEYSVGEDRELIGLPLNLSESEKEMLVKRILEQHYNYQGKYKFVYNNCAHETFNLIKSATSDLPLQRENITTPFGLLETLVKHKKVDYSLLNDKNSAQNKWLIFPSISNNLQEYLKDLLTEEEMKKLSEEQKRKAGNDILWLSTIEKEKILLNALRNIILNSKEKILLTEQERQALHGQEVILNSNLPSTQGSGRHDSSTLSWPIIKEIFTRNHNIFLDKKDIKEKINRTFYAIFSIERLKEKKLLLMKNESLQNLMLRWYKKEKIDKNEEQFMINFIAAQKLLKYLQSIPANMIMEAQVLLNNTPTSSTSSTSSISSNRINDIKNCNSESKLITHYNNQTNIQIIAEQLIEFNRHVQVIADFYNKKFAITNEEKNSWAFQDMVINMQEGHNLLL